MEEFAAEVRLFEKWAHAGTDSGALAAKNGVMRLTRLYFSIHWGEHITGAIRALHCWLAANHALDDSIDME
jgi:hypothetical protein